MAKRIVIDVNEDPALTKADWDDFTETLTFFVSTYFDIKEITMKVESE